MATATATTFDPATPVTFTITKMPRNAAAVKTLQRLMRLEPSVQRGLRRVAKRRARVDNRPHPRGGRTWIIRASASKLVTPAVGASFTIRVTPQIAPDLRSVEKYLAASA